MESETGTEKKGFFSHLTPTRALILLTAAIFSVVGIVGSFNNSPVSIEKFAGFLDAFAYFFIPLVIGVAGGGVAKNYLKTKTNGTHPTDTTTISVTSEESGK
tara:strand:+ start:491 stop:796 length:306 start_codon:yes stop_codon:yes gene_type:complete